MTPATLALVLGGIAVSATLLGVLGLVVFRELRRALDFDRRLGMPRSQALGFGLGAAPRSRGQRREIRALGLALLRQAGFAQPDALSYFLSLKFAGAALLGAGAGLWGQGLALLDAHTVLLAFTVLAGLVVGGIVPEYLLRALVARRLRGMARALPDALDLMVMCLESGLTFERALLTVAVELSSIEPSLAAEFRQIEAELRVGADRRAVLQAFYRRTAIEGLRDMAMTLIQSERFGTPLAQAMRNIAANERLQRGARAAARADRLPVLMTLPMLLFVVPGTLLLVAGPAFLGAIEALGGLGGGGIGGP